MLEWLRQWLKRHSWWAGGVGAVALVLLGGAAGALFDDLFNGSIEDELKEQVRVARGELDELVERNVVAREELDVLTEQVRQLETARAQDRAIAQREIVRETLLSFLGKSPTLENEPRLEEIFDLQRQCNDTLNAGDPVMALDCYQEVTVLIREFCDAPERPCGPEVLPPTGGPPPN